LLAWEWASLALLILYYAITVLNRSHRAVFPGLCERALELGPILDLLKHLWIPALISAVTGTGGLIRIMRGNLLETLGQPFVEAARARGLKYRTVTWKHAVRIAINPLIVISGQKPSGNCGRHRAGFRSAQPPTIFPPTSIRASWIYI
jgi:peptide/nickel transport system permease protein